MAKEKERVEGEKRVEEQCRVQLCRVEEGGIGGAINLGVQYLQDLEFCFSVDDNRWRWSFSSIWELVGGRGF